MGMDSQSLYPTVDPAGHRFCTYLGDLRHCFANGIQYTAKARQLEINEVALGAKEEALCVAVNTSLLQVGYSTATYAWCPV